MKRTFNPAQQAARAAATRRWRAAHTDEARVNAIATEHQKRDATTPAQDAVRRERIRLAQQACRARRDAAETPAQRAERKALAAARGRAYRARKKLPDVAVPTQTVVMQANPELDVFCLKEAARLAQLRTRLFGNKWELDHITPRSRGGISVAGNIQVVPSAWNRSKYNLHDKRFLGA